MGHALSSISSFLTKGSKQVVMVGLDFAGKTSILNQLRFEVAETTPTVGLSVETTQYRNLELTAFEVGGGAKIRPLWRHFFEKSDAAIFVFDSQDQEKDNYERAAGELHKLSADMAESCPILIFANKQDLEDAMNREEIKKILHPHDLKQKEWHIQLCSARTGEGVSEGFEWIENILCPK